MAAKNTQTNNSKPTVNNQSLAKQPVPVACKNSGTEVLNKVLDAAIEYCKNDPKTAKKIGGSVMLGAGIGIAVGGGLMIASSF